MIRLSWSRGRTAWRLLHLSARTIAGRRYWIAALLPLLWIGFQIFRLLVGFREESFTPADAQNVLLGFPLTVLAIGLGVRVIAGDIDRRTLEIAYTVPGGTHRVWLAKLAAAVLLLLASETLLALATFTFCTAFPGSALYGALQGAVVYLVLAMAMAALFRGEAVGALVTVALLGVNAVMLPTALRFSPFWNPEAIVDLEAADRLAGLVQNRIGWLLAIAAIAALAFGRAERREKLLSG